MSVFVWVPYTEERRALQRIDSNDRIAATGFANEHFRLNLELADGQLHRVALYLLDWDSAGREHVVSVYDRANGELLDRQQVENFAEGLYQIWSVRGAVAFEVTNVSQGNAVTSAVFVEPDTNRTPSIALVSPGPGSSVTAPTTITVQATASDEDGIRKVEFYDDSSRIGETAEPPYVLTWTNALAGTHQLTARAVDGAGGFSISIPVNITVDLPKAVARFIQWDDFTRGTWTETYGAHSYSMAGSNSTPDGWHPKTIGQATQLVWAFPSDDTRAVVVPASEQRIAAAWFSPTALDLDLVLPDGYLHRVAAYFLDWDQAGRRQSVSVVDPTDGTVLDERTVDRFSGGLYGVWDIRGHVHLRVRNLAGTNAVLSAVFIGPTNFPAEVTRPEVMVANSGAPWGVPILITSATPHAVIRAVPVGAEPDWNPVLGDPGICELFSAGAFNIRGFRGGLDPSPLVTVEVGDFDLILLGNTGVQYVFERSSDLRFWQALSTNTAPAGGLIGFSDPEALTVAERFYRVRRHYPPENP
jgi:hypothetical protein